MLLKAVSKDKSGTEMFTLRNIDGSKVMSCGDLKDKVRRQLHVDIISRDFDVGYVNVNSMISIRNPADLANIWADVRKSKKVVLWCDGLKTKPTKSSSRRRATKETDEDETDEDDDNSLRPPARKKKSKTTAQEQREEKVQSYIVELKGKNGNLFTPMQIRISSEMIAGGIHSNLEDAPTSSMFTRAGKCVSKMKVLLPCQKH